MNISLSSWLPGHEIIITIFSDYEDMNSMYSKLLYIKELSVMGK